MKLFLLSQDDNCDYDTFDSCVVVAKNEEEAKTIKLAAWASSRTWTDDLSKIEVICIGTANKNVKRGEVICVSFNAG